jgi:hypothetical protein
MRTPAVIVRLLLLALLLAGAGVAGSAPAPLDVTAHSHELPEPAGDEPAIAVVDAEPPAPPRARPRSPDDRNQLADPLRAGVFRPPRS